MDVLPIGTQRLIHLDLKGGPLKLAFYEKFFPFIKTIGATGILIEWEDTFPYTKELINIGSLSAGAISSNAPYSIEEAKQILCLAEDNDLCVIPLVQTFGHMEFVLKHEQWSALREIETYPSSMCPSNGGTLALVCSLLKQIIGFHRNSQYIHIGADEVWHMGVCAACARRVHVSKYGKVSLYLDHLTQVVHYIKDNYPALRIIIWDDMIRNVDERILQEYYIGSLVEPMIWHYQSAETFQLGGALWEKYGNVFLNVWGATAFKGATSSCQLMPVARYHISNHEMWLAELGSHVGKLRNFRGIALTGWSRYDHYATLCELLPCGIPSLHLCMRTWLSGGFNPDVMNAVAKALGYANGPMSLHLDIPVRPVILPHELAFPGWQVLVGIEWFANIKTKYKCIIDSDQMQTWFNQWQVHTNYTNPMQIESILPILTEMYLEISSLENFVRVNFEPFFYQPTIDEILGTLVHPIKQHVHQLKCECEAQIANGCRVRARRAIV